MTEEQKKSSNFVVDYKNLMKSIEVIAKNKQGFGYNYADLNAVYEEVKPKIMENNFVLIQTVQRGDGMMKRRDTAVPVAKDKDGNILLSGAVDWELPVYNLHSEIIHETGKTLTCDIPLVMDDVDPQALGSSITYMRRYSLFVLLGVITEDDDGLRASAKGKFNQNYGKKPLPETYEEIAQFLVSSGEDPKKYYGDVKNHKSLTDEQKKKLIKIIYPN